MDIRRVSNDLRVRRDVQVRRSWTLRLRICPPSCSTALGAPAIAIPVVDRCRCRVRGAWICATSEAAYRQRLSRARQAVRQFVQEHCGLVSPERAQCHCRRRVPTAVALGRVDPASAARATAEEIAAAVQEIGTLYDAAGLLRSLPDARAPEALASRIKALIGSGLYRVLSD